MVLIMKSVFNFIHLFSFFFFRRNSPNMLLTLSQPYTGKYISVSAETTGQTSSSPPNSLI